MQDAMHIEINVFIFHFHLKATFKIESSERNEQPQNEIRNLFKAAFCYSLGVLWLFLAAVL